MKLILFLALVMAFSFTFAISNQSAFAQRIILGEFEGKGSLTVSTKRNGEMSSYVNNCKMAYNLNLSAQKLEMNFGVVECEGGLDVWNDGPYYFTIQNGKVMRNNVNVGEIDNNGVATFKAYKLSTKIFQVAHYDSDCNISSLEDKQIKVGQQLTFSLKKLSDISYQLTRQEISYEAATAYKKEWPQCPATVDYSESENRTSFNVIVTK